MKPLISIIVPVYNVEDYVLKCLKSLAGQSYDSIEIIVVDDGSTDNSGKICDEFALDDKRVRVYHKKNGGLSSARNFGIKKAKGEYICLVDSDDYVKKDFVEKMVGASVDADIVICGYNHDIPEAGELTGGEATIRLLTRQDNIEIIAWNKMYRRELFKEISYPEGKNYEDNLTTYRLLSKAKKVVYVAEPLYVYVERGGSIMNSSKKEEKLVHREMAAKEAIEYFSHDKKLKDASEIALLTANLAYMDFAISGDIEKRFLKKGKEWVVGNKFKLVNNQFLTKKLRIYINMVTRLGGILYVAFRKVRHE